MGGGFHESQAQSQQRVRLLEQVIGVTVGPFGGNQQRGLAIALDDNARSRRHATLSEIHAVHLDI
jgi:hypothetical protein